MTDIIDYKSEYEKVCKERDSIKKDLDELLAIHNNMMYNFILIGMDIQNMARRGRLERV